MVANAAPLVVLMVAGSVLYLFIRSLRLWKVCLYDDTREIWPRVPIEAAWTSLSFSIAIFMWATLVNKLPSGHYTNAMERFRIATASWPRNATAIWNSSVLTVVEDGRQWEEPHLLPLGRAAHPPYPFDLLPYELTTQQKPTNLDLNLPFFGVVWAPTEEAAKAAAKIPSWARLFSGERIAEAVMESPLPLLVLSPKKARVLTHRSAGANHRAYFRMALDNRPISHALSYQAVPLASPEAFGGRARHLCDDLGGGELKCSLETLHRAYLSSLDDENGFAARLDRDCFNTVWLLLPLSLFWDVCSWWRRYGIIVYILSAIVYLARWGAKLLGERGARRTWQRILVDLVCIAVCTANLVALAYLVVAVVAHDYSGAADASGGMDQRQFQSSERAEWLAGLALAAGLPSPSSSLPYVTSCCLAVATAAFTLQRWDLNVLSRRRVGPARRQRNVRIAAPTVLAAATTMVCLTWPVTPPEVPSDSELRCCSVQVREFPEHRVVFQAGEMVGPLHTSVVAPLEPARAYHFRVLWHYSSGRVLTSEYTDAVVTRL